MRQFATILVALALVTCTDGQIPTQSKSQPAAAVKTDWPIFRGNPALHGVAAGTLEDSLSLAWTFTSGAEITSSAVVHDGTVFFGSCDQNVYAVDLETFQHANRVSRVVGSSVCIA